MFREIREIKVKEIRKEKEKEKELPNGYLNIKPETNISPEEADSFWDNLFKSLEEK